MDLILYTMIVFLATALGAISGSGGGAIIKPSFDLIGIDNVMVIGIYSTIAVFSMCVSSLYKQYKSGIIFQKNTLIGLTIGSLLGGIIGEIFFQIITKSQSNQTVTLIQSILLVIILIFTLIFTKYMDKLPRFQIRNLMFSLISSCVIGILSVFVGIGGRPLNIIVLIGLMSFSTKDSTFYSIAMIFFAQIPKIMKIILTMSPMSFRWEVVPFIVIAALSGGFIGTQFNRKLSNQQIEIVFSVLTVILLGVCIVNIVNNV